MGWRDRWEVFFGEFLQQTESCPTPALLRTCGDRPPKGTKSTQVPMRSLRLIHRSPVGPFPCDACTGSRLRACPSSQAQPQEPRDLPPPGVGGSFLLREQEKSREGPRARGEGHGLAGGREPFPLVQLMWRWHGDTLPVRDSAARGPGLVLGTPTFLPCLLGFALDEHTHSILHRLNQMKIYVENVSLCGQYLDLMGMLPPWWPDPLVRDTVVTQSEGWGAAR